MNEIVINNNNGTLTVSSLQVAEDFGKRHDHIIRDIESIIKGLPKIGETPQKPFIEAEYQHSQNKQIYKYYEMTRDGFSLLIMGFTGSKALEWKYKYIQAFNEIR